MPFPFLDKVTGMLRLALSDRISPVGDDYLDLFSGDAVFEFPFSPGGAIHIERKEKMAAYLESIKDGVALEEFTLKASYPVADGATTVLEHDSKGHNRESKRPYAQSYVTVLRIADGQITRFCEYLNPLAVQAASGTGDKE